MTTEQDAGTRKSRGRPKTFNREAALDKALELFWRHGYEGTSLADLVEATGAKAPTLYAEFTNKEGMFRAAVDRYTEKFCFFICTSSGLSADSSEVAEMLRHRHNNQESNLLEFLQLRQKAGELDERTNIRALAAFLGCLLQGMSVRAREGATRAELDELIDTLMKQWPALSKLGCC